MTGKVHCERKLLLLSADVACITQVNAPVILVGTGFDRVYIADVIPLDTTFASNVDSLLVGVIMVNITFQPLGILAEQVKLRSSFPVVFTFTWG